mgnify:CR=1 FL=1
MASGSQSLGTGYNNASVQGLSLISGATGGSPQGIYEESSTQEYPIGQLREFEDGRCFRYSSFAATAVPAGRLVSPDQSATSLARTTSGVPATAAGEKEFSITLASVTANQYAGGIIHFVATAAANAGGTSYRIKSNSATGATTSGKVDFVLYDGLAAALTTSTYYAISSSPYNTVVITDVTHGSVDDFIVAGVTMRAMTASYYGWIQTAGIATILCDGATTAADILTCSDGVNGAVQIQDAYTEPIIGFATFAATDTEHGGVMLSGLER